MNEKVEEIGKKLVEYLTGTCNDFDILDYDYEVLDYLDDRIFRCYECDWWSEIEDMMEFENGFDEPVCTDCGENYE